MDCKETERRISRTSHRCPRQDRALPAHFRKYKLRRKLRFGILVLEILAILIIAGVFAYALL